MCGIAGFYHLQKKQIDASALDRMLRAIQHRGPDASGQFYDNHIGFTHARLSIIDLDEAANQPMLSADQKYVLAFNGEIYNYKSLRKELEALGHAFRTQSDTEVVLLGFIQWGTDLFPKLNGFFGLSIYNKEKKELVLARDRIGIKPLYYGAINGIVLFASELQAIKASDLVPCEIDNKAALSFLNYQYLMREQSIYQNIYKLLPGHYLVINENIEDYSYWDIKDHSIENNALTLEQNIDRTEQLLVDTIKLRLQSDVPLGAFLSGGTDSSLVSAIAQNLTGHQLQTFTIGFDVEGLNETPYAQEVSGHIGSDHTTQILSAKDVLEVVPNIPNIYGEPYADSSSIPTYLLSKMTRNKVTVALSGDGGDELFWGYDRYVMVNKILDKIRSVPNALRSPLIFLSKILPQKKIQRLHQFLERYQKTGNLAELYAWTMQNFDPKEIQELAGREIVNLQNYPAELGLFFKDKLQDERLLMSLIDISTYLPDDILTKVDRASMQHGLEARTPLLDHRIVEHALSIPLEQKLKNEPKHILKQLLRKYIDPQLVDRPKSGFTVPLKNWMQGPLKDDILDKCAINKPDDQGVIHPLFTQKQLDLFFQNKLDNTNKVWTIYMFHLWLSKQ